jgi:hypothetical protein
MEPQECWEKWIPGLRLTAHPGTTRKDLDGCRIPRGMTGIARFSSLATRPPVA